MVRFGALGQGRGQSRWRGGAISWPWPQVLGTFGHKRAWFAKLTEYMAAEDRSLRKFNESFSSISRTTYGVALHCPDPIILSILKPTKCSFTGLCSELIMAALFFSTILTYKSSLQGAALFSNMLRLTCISGTGAIQMHCKFNQVQCTVVKFSNCWGPWLSAQCSVQWSASQWEVHLSGKCISVGRADGSQSLFSECIVGHLLCWNSRRTNVGDLIFK